LRKNGSDSPAQSSRLLATGELTPAIVMNAGARSPFLLLGDHAGRAIPAALKQLGVADAEMERHIAWDIGVAGLGELLSRALDACFIRQAYSRLVIDCNRRPGAVGSIPVVSDGSAIPGNRSLTPEETQARVDEIYTPYQERIAAELDERSGTRTVVVALHSFTPSMQGFDRPWHFGVLHDGKSPFSRAVLARLQAALGEQAGDNQPYAMDGTDNTVPLHAGTRGLDYLELEVRQDLLADEEGQQRVAAFLTPILTGALDA
jgi:predicted N-formylglutamate amidohydrolase